MLGLLLIAAMPIAEELSFERMLLCQAYHEQWQWDEHNAGRKVPDDFPWYRPFRDKLHAAGAAKGLSREQVVHQGNALVNTLKPALTAEQNADWAKCRKELGWAPNPDGSTIN